MKDDHALIAQWVRLSLLDELPPAEFRCDKGSLEGFLVDATQIAEVVAERLGRGEQPKELSTAVINRARLFDDELEFRRRERVKQENMARKAVEQTELGDGD